TPGAAAQAVAVQNSLRRILLDDGSGRQNPAVIPYPAPELSAYNTVRSGDRVIGLQGVLHYSFDEYRIQPTSTPIFVPDNARTPEPDLPGSGRSEEHTSELQSRENLVCRLLLEKKKDGE